MFLHVVSTSSFVFLILSITCSEKSSLMNLFQASPPLPTYSQTLHPEYSLPINHCICHYSITLLICLTVCLSNAMVSIPWPQGPRPSLYSHRQCLRYISPIWHAASSMNTFMNELMFFHVYFTYQK